MNNASSRVRFARGEEGEGKDRRELFIVETLNVGQEGEYTVELSTSHSPLPAAHCPVIISGN